VEEYQDISVLMERAKELECLYLIDEALTGNTLPDVLMEITRVTPLGFRNVKACTVAIELDGVTYAAKPVIANGSEIRSEIVVNDSKRGFITAAYPSDTFPKDDIVFLTQEVKLLNTISNRISQYIYQRSIQAVDDNRSSWETIIKLLQNTDQGMLLRVCEKMFALLAASNPKLIKDIFTEMDWAIYKYQGEINFPLKSLPSVDVIRLSKSLFQVASTYLEDSQILDYINLWIYQGKTYELIKLVDKRDSDVKDISKALAQYLKAVKSNEMSSKATQRWLTVELIRRFLTDNPKFIENARKYVSVEDIYGLLDTFICSPQSIGKIGGKATGFFIAYQIIKYHTANNPELGSVKIPRTWYISSDELSNLIHDNGLDELNEHKYRDLFEIRLCYPKVIQTLKNSRMSSYVLNELNKILDQTEDKPLIIRSSSLLEDQRDSAFSGKYKSLFVTNTGTRAKRLQSLVEGILEVYASIFSPDSIQYRKERNLLDSNEQMGIMIQEVVGCKVGPYYFPLYAGVAFSNNEFRWSPRIEREDGLLRMVMGLGTRAVDRIGNDYPILISPGQPNLSVNQAPQELKKYSPQMMDVIDIENDRFLTVPISELIKDYGNEIPYLNYVASVLKNDFITGLNRITTDFKNDDIVITFDGLINNTSIIRQIRSVLMLLKEKLGYAVDIEFASDGKNFYLLQCRPQSINHDSMPVAIPTNISSQSTVFTANRYISNGKVVGIKTVVYVDPEEYGKLENLQDMVNVGIAVSELNRILPRRSFILMGPGRWGSRGDIKLGVQVTYSDINNTSMLIEIAQKKSKYHPELSFGTHFFQDLVEENIKYLPLYPEDDEIVFNKSFFTQSPNELGKILPMYSYLDSVIKVVSVPENYYGKELVVLMNADLEKAIAYLDNPSENNTNSSIDSRVFEIKSEAEKADNEGWKWRHYMAEQIASQMDMETFGVKGIYLFGSTNTCTARLNSDIDLLVHFEGSGEQKQKLDTWFNGWSKALSAINYLKTGYQSDGLLDVHYVTDQDIEEKNSYAIKINSAYEPAFPLRIRRD
jgi:pyruvate,water dikinase